MPYFTVNHVTNELNLYVCRSGSANEITLAGRITSLDLSPGNFLLYKAILYSAVFDGAKICIALHCGGKY